MNSSAVDHEGAASRTRTSVPPSTGTTWRSTTPSSSKRSTIRSPSSTDSTIASRVSLLSQRNTPRPPGVASSSTSFANHSSSCVSSVSASHTSAGAASSSISRTTSTSNLLVAYYWATEQLHASDRSTALLIQLVIQAYGRAERA